MKEEKKLFDRVLIIDDDRVSTYLTQINIEEMGVAEEVTVLENGQSGIHFLKQHCINEHAASKDCPDLILLDINMPVMDGFEFLETLQRLGQHNLIETVVVVLTSSNSSKDQEKMRSLGVRGFITKPVTEEEIRRMVSN